MSNYHDITWAAETMESARSKANGKPIQNNTRLFANEDGSYRIRLHNTDIVTINVDGTYTLVANGYHTVTTAQRMRAYSPVKLISDRGEWFIRIEPSDDDLRPDRVERTVPKPYEATDPGDEPIKDDNGCQAGTMMGTDHINEPVHIFRKDAKMGDNIVKDPAIIEDREPRDYDFVDVERSWTSWVFYGADAYSYQSKEWNDPETNKENVKYEQCPHCKAFDTEHERWRLKMHGARWGVKFDQQTGYKMYAAMMERYGTQEAWQEAYIADFRERREYLRLDREWEERNRVAFYDGITVDSEGYAPRIRKSGPSPAKLRRHKAEVKRVRKAIDSYIAAFIDQLREGMAMPSSGDCWYCSMKTDQGVPLGDSMPTLHEDGQLTNELATDHLWAHIEEKYYVPSLITNAMLERGYKPLGVYMLLDMNQDEQTMGGRGNYDGPRRDLRKYMEKRLIPATPTK